MPIPTKNSINSVGASFNFEGHTGISDSIFNYVNDTFAAVIISDVDNNTSLVAARKVINSIEKTKSNLLPVIIPATTPKTLDKHLANFNLTKKDWTYPSIPGESVYSIKAGMKLTAYNAKDVNKVIACAVSHMRVWMMSVGMNVPIIVLEHDALFTRRFPGIPKDQRYGVIGLNDPRGATRMANIYLQRVLNNHRTDNTEIVNAPYVDDNDTFTPQGIAGNSAYVIFPNAASQLINKIQEVGLWPNDALMCKQFFPWLRQAYPFYTTLQGVASTTQG